jgi:hypothetical protein
MTACQQEPLMLSTFNRFYLKWYLNNFDAIVGLIKEWLAVYRKTKTGIHARIQENQFCLEAAYKLYLTYRENKGFISREDSLTDYDSYYNQLRAIAIEQNARVTRQNSNNAPPKTNYLTIIRSLYREDRFKLAESAKRFNKDEHDGLINDDYLYLRRERLIKRIKSSGRSVDIVEVLDNLKSQQALRLGKDGNTRQLHGCKENYRFYAIPLYMLM